MKLASFMVLWCLSLLVSCGKKKSHAPPMTEQTLLHGAARADAAEAQVLFGGMPIAVFCGQLIQMAFHRWPSFTDSSDFNPPVKLHVPI